MTIRVDDFRSNTEFESGQISPPGNSSNEI